MVIHCYITFYGSVLVPFFLFSFFKMSIFNLGNSNIILGNTNFYLGKSNLILIAKNQVGITKIKVDILKNRQKYLAPIRFRNFHIPHIMLKTDILKLFLLNHFPYHCRAV